MTIYDTLLLSWYLSTTKYNIINNYIDILHYIINNKKYNKVIFIGSSGGGYPSLYFASYFNKIAIISNPQIYLENYKYYNNLIEILNKNNDELLYHNKDIEKILLNKLPQKIIFYRNKKDVLSYNDHFLPFINFINKNKLYNILDNKLFDNNNDLPNGKTQHHILYPNNTNIIQIIKNIIN